MRPFSLLAAFLLFFTIHAQDTHGTAMHLTREAVRLMDQGAPDQAIVLLEQAIMIDPDAHIHM